MNSLRYGMFCVFFGVQGLAAASDVPIAGVKPFERPAGAPVLTTDEKTGAWYQQALTGVSQPYPGSLRFLERQGRWHTPFIQPGMTGPYDIRGWHRQPPAE